MRGALGLLERAFPGAFADEPRSACARCPAARPSDDGLAPRFAPELKCCTYWPALPNYAVGRILRDGGPGAARIRARLPARSPLRVGPPPGWSGAGPVGPRFGRDPAMRCPYLDDGACSVWAHREAVCATFFCRTSAGVRGRRAWRAARDWAHDVEDLVADACAAALLDPASLERARAAGPMGIDTPEALFGAWAEGRAPTGAAGPGSPPGAGGPAPRNAPGPLGEPPSGSGDVHWQEAFFLACAAHADTLDAAPFVGAVPPEAVLDALAGRDAPTDGPLIVARPGVDAHVRVHEDHVSLAHGESPFDPVRLPRAVWDMLDARRVLRVGDPLRDELGDALRTMVDHGVLLYPHETAVPCADSFDADAPLRLPQRRGGLRDEPTGVALESGVATIRAEDAASADLLRGLHRHRNGFLAREALAWSGLPEDEVLGTLRDWVACGFLEQVERVGE